MTGRVLAVFCICLAWVENSAFAARIYEVVDAASLAAVPEQLEAGDKVILADGVYHGVSRSFRGNGMAGQPIVIRAAVAGNARMTGATQLVLKGRHMVLAGLRFEGEGGTSGPLHDSGVIRLAVGSEDCRVSNCMIRNFNREAQKATAWIMVEGFRHVVEYCSFEGKTTEKPVVVLAAPEEESRANEARGHRIRFCYFGPRTVIGSNGYETIRLGDSKTQSVNMAAEVEKIIFTGPSTGMESRRWFRTSRRTTSTARIHSGKTVDSSACGMGMVAPSRKTISWGFRGMPPAGE